MTDPTSAEEVPARLVAGHDASGNLIDQRSA